MGSPKVPLDIVFTNARVIDPQTGLDAIRNIGIAGATIAEVSTRRLHGKQVIDATGLVAAP
jgi:N-acyl-D-glutamate deacylase